MTNVVVRPYLPTDWDGFAQVNSLTYYDGQPVPEERREMKFPGQRYVAEREGEIIGAFVHLDLTATRGNALLANAGVAGVAVSPDRRRGGVGNAMMNWFPGYLRENNVPLASLYAFRETFYAKSGYAVVGKRLRLNIPSHRLPKGSGDLPIRRLAPEDWRILAPCHTQFAHRQSGVNVRSEPMWERVLAEGKPLTIYAMGDPVEGYIAVNHSVSFWTEQWISEVAWSTPRGYENCLQMIRQICINKTNAAWYEPSDSEFYGRYLDQGVEVKVDRPVMFRVCDVRNALALLKPSSAGEFKIAVDDPQVPENRGPWHVSFDKTGVQVEPCSQADFELDIPTFTQVFMGDPSLSDLVRQGRVHSARALAIESTVALLPGLPVYCSDFF